MGPVHKVWIVAENGMTGPSTNNALDFEDKQSAIELPEEQLSTSLADHSSLLG